VIEVPNTNLELEGDRAIGDLILRTQGANIDAPGLAGWNTLHFAPGGKVLVKSVLLASAA